MREYDGIPMRDVLLDRLPDTTYPQFLVYVMSSYTTFKIEYMLSEDVDADEVDVDLGAFDETDQEFIDELREMVDWIRSDLGFNAFIAVDPAIPTEQDVTAAESEADEGASPMNVLAQSKAYAEASNTVLFILPKAGLRDGVTTEIGAVLDAMKLGAEHTDPVKDRRRFMVCRESAVQSATLDAIEYEYGVPVREYTTRKELEALIYDFIQSVARLEFSGEIPPVSDEREDSDTER